MSAALLRAKARLDRLNYYPDPVRLEGVRVLVAPWVFWLFGRGYSGMMVTRWLILMRRSNYSDNLLTHELCHVWQEQNVGGWRMWKTYGTVPYAINPYEVEARRAVLETT